MSLELDNYRFSADRDLLGEILGSGVLGPVSGETEQKSLRAKLLATAVRVDLRLIPSVAASLDSLRNRLNIEHELEAYVYENSGIHAYVAKGTTRYLVVLSSGCINHLSSKEVEFVIGHELGHLLYGHLDIAASSALNSTELSPRANIKLRSWQRAAEISADRVGLVCCESIDTAAHALFKSVSGLYMQNLSLDPIEFAQQWDHLEKEVLSSSEAFDHKYLTHPFPPLRMKAMNAFWNFWHESGSVATTKEALQKIDGEINSLLRLIDPTSQNIDSRHDTFFETLILWGGLYVAYANGRITSEETKRIGSLVSERHVQQAIDNTDDSEICLARFQTAVGGANDHVTPILVRNIIDCLITIAAADGHVDRKELDAIQTLAKVLGLSQEACDLLLKEYSSQTDET